MIFLGNLYIVSLVNLLSPFPLQINKLILVESLSAPPKDMLNNEKVVKYFQTFRY